jgi:hypothetical protein
MTSKPRWMRSVIEAAKAQKGPVLPTRRASARPTVRYAATSKA